MHGVVYTVVLAALSLTLTTHAFPDGAPNSVCFGRFTPNHPAGNASDAPGGFFIDSDLRDTNFRFNETNVNETPTNYTITLFSTGRPFRGFVIQVCITTRFGHFCPNFAGEFVEFPPSARMLDCSDPSTLSGGGASLTHVDNSDKLSVSATWTPGKTSGGTAQIRYTVVTEYNSTYYADLDAANYPPPEPPQTTEPTQTTESTKPSQTTEPTRPTQTIEPTKPTQTTEPTQPAQTTEPTRPNQTTEPTRPTQTTEPTRPTQTIEPTRPTQTTEPTRPTQTTEPTRPTQPPCPLYPGKKRRKCFKKRKQRRKWWRKLWRQWWRRWGY